MLSRRVRHAWRGVRVHTISCQPPGTTRMAGSPGSHHIVPAAGYDTHSGEFVSWKPSPYRPDAARLGPCGAGTEAVPFRPSWFRDWTGKPGSLGVKPKLRTWTGKPGAGPFQSGATPNSPIWTRGRKGCSGTLLSGRRRALSVRLWRSANTNVGPTEDGAQRRPQAAPSVRSTDGVRGPEQSFARGGGQRPA